MMNHVGKSSTNQHPPTKYKKTISKVHQDNTSDMKRERIQLNKWFQINTPYTEIFNYLCCQSYYIEVKDMLELIQKPQMDEF